MEKSVFSNRKEFLPLVIILGIVLALRLGVFLVIYPADPSRIMSPDSFGYDRLARTLARTGHFAVSPDRPELPEIKRTPGYPAFIASVYLIFGENHLPVIVIQILLSIGTIILTYILARTLWNQAAALIAALLLALDPVSFLY